MLLLCPPGCATYDAPPRWINTPPVEDGYLYGVGSYVGALHPEDNVLHAMDIARGMLSRNIRSRVVSETIIRETEARTRSQSQTLVGADEVFEHVELIATWVDRTGLTGRFGIVWVLMRIPSQP